MKKDKYLKIPHNCYIILTANCNMRCKHCYGNYGINVPQKELSGAEWIKIIEDLSKKGVFFVNISGGEPTVHPDFEMIIKALVKNQIYFMLTTNGVFSEKILNSIINAKDYILGIQVSLDGPDWSSHGYLRRDLNGNSSEVLFKRAFNSIKKFRLNNIRVSVASCIHKENIDKMDKFKEIIFELSPNNWSLSTISISGRAINYDNLFVSEAKLTNDYWQKLKNECEDHQITIDFIDMPNILKHDKKSKIYYECPAAKWFCEINSDGMTTPCPLARVNPPKRDIIWDNIKNKSIEEIWNGDSFNNFRWYQNNGCEGCNVKDKCDRCPPQSVQWFNDPLMPTPYCILNGKSLELNNLYKLKKKLDLAKTKNNRKEYEIKE
jgi:MoaA/NifB/PqqE/SkfB family radical SAM enzyme